MSRYASTLPFLKSTEDYLHLGVQRFTFSPSICALADVIAAVIRHNVLDTLLDIAPLSIGTPSEAAVFDDVANAFVNLTRFGKRERRYMFDVEPARHADCSAD